MFATKTPLLWCLQMLGIFGSVIAALLITGNPLALFALMLVWSPPPITTEEEQKESQGTRIGFVQSDE